MITTKIGIDPGRVKLYTENYKIMEKTKGRPARFSRDDVLDAATRLFGRHGFEGTSLGELVSAIGCTPPSLYNYFRSKEELYVEVLHRYWSREFPEPPPQGRARTVLEAYIGATLTRFCPNQGPRGCLVLTGGFRGAPGHADLQDLLRAKRSEAMTTLLGLTKAMQQQGDLDPTLDPATWALTLFALVQGLALQAMDGADRTALEAAVALFFSKAAPGAPSSLTPRSK